jgi:predicted nucleic acid-binding protein
VTYLLDTTAFSSLMRRDAKIRTRITALAPTDRIVICTITRGEVLYGLVRLPPGRRRSALEAEAMHLFAQLVCLFGDNG